MTEDEYISAEGLENVKNELKVAKGQTRIEIANKLEYAKSLGDLSENAEYAQAKEEHEANEADIRRLEEFLSRAKILKKSDVASSHVQLGGTVSIRGEGGDEKYTIVGTQEVDIDAGKISQESPFGKALLGKKKGEVTTVRGPKGDQEYTIIDIE